MQMPVNDSGTFEGNGAIDVPKPIRNFSEETRRALIAVRIKHGANTPIGHRCSNIVEMLESAAPPAMIAKQMASLEQLLKAA